MRTATSAEERISVEVSEEHGPESTSRTISLHLGHRAGPKIFFETSGVRLSELVTHDFAVLASLFYAMRAGKRLHVSGPVSRTLLRNMEDFQEAWTIWWPAYKPVEVTADSEVEDIQPAARRGVMAFSGGVDSTFALLRHHHGLSGRRTCRPVAAMLVHGFDIPLTATTAFETAAASTRDTLSLIGVPLAIVRTNWRVVCGEWKFEFAAGLAACLHQFAGVADLGVIGADEDYAHLELPWSSNPITNHFFSGGTFAIHTEGAGFVRTDRVELISRYPEIAKRLRVCWEGPITGKNCGRCEKCVRTKLNFLAVGREPLCFDGRPTHFQIMRIDTSHPIQEAFLEEIRESARKRGIRDRWLTFLSLAILKNKLLSPFRKPYNRAKQLARSVIR